MPLDPIELTVFANLFASAAEEMGVTLGRAAYSPNIKERRDFSCAVFDAQGRMVAQAAHIPVHLGAMPVAVQVARERHAFGPGDLVIFNDPYLGGTHLPDVTMVSAAYAEADGGPQLLGYLASRAHQADIGGISAGSMPVSTELYQEGIIIPPLKLVVGGQTNEALLQLIYRNVRTPQERAGDFAAQMAAHHAGEVRLRETVARYGLSKVQEAMEAVMDYAEAATRATIHAIPDG
ncbi:MAG: hydantoinase B/oxoprolinase family protein, partial [Chloroflexi bacterium]|nr:hydantoinase B/oxoprolinase family protein [Chloroflexota bacterium]